MFDGVLDMLSGRYPSDEFAELRPRVTWDRVAGTITAREGAKRVAIANGGTIPDRGLYGVFLLGAGPGAARVGELDEEMVFESRVGETFVLGASSWRIEEITHDRVLVSPAPGEPGKMPFWKGDRAGRPLELGLAIGRLMHDLLRLPPAAAVDRLTREHDLDARAAENLLQYLRDQLAAARAVPDATTIVIERVRDELGDWRVCVLSPRGGRIHAPWAMAVAAKIREETGADVETLWGDDGFVVRFPDVDQPPDPRLLLPDPDEVQALVVRQLGATALFAAKFRENAARSLLLPKRRPGHARAALAAAQARRRSAGGRVALRIVSGAARDLPRVPARFLRHAGADRDARRHPQPQDPRSRPSIPRRRRRSPRRCSSATSPASSTTATRRWPSAARRRWRSISRSCASCSATRSCASCSTPTRWTRSSASCSGSIRSTSAKSADGVHDMLLSLGDLTEAEIARARRSAPTSPPASSALVAARRVLAVRIAGEPRFIAVEDAARYRDALGVPLPAGIPESLLQPVRDPLGDLALRYARTHAPFTAPRLRGALRPARRGAPKRC